MISCRLLAYAALAVSFAVSTASFGDQPIPESSGAVPAIPSKPSSPIGSKALPYRLLLYAEVSGNDNAAVADVREYGAVADNVTDSTAAFQRAADALRSRGGGILYVPESGGSWFRVRRIETYSKIIHVIEGNIRSVDNADAPIFASPESNEDVDNVVFSGGGKLDGNKARNSATNGIVISGSDVLIKMLNFFNFAQTAIDLGKPSGTARNIRIEGNRVENCGKRNGWGGIAVTDGNGVRILNNVVSATDGQMAYGIDLEPNPGSSMEKVEISGNTVSQGRIFVDFANIKTGYDVDISNNTVSADGSYCTAGTTESMAPIFVRNANGIRVRENILTGDSTCSTASLRQGINVTRQISDFVITGNLILMHDVAGREVGLSFGNEAGIGLRGIIANNSFIALDGRPAYGLHSVNPKGLVEVQVYGNTQYGIAGR